MKELSKPGVCFNLKLRLFSLSTATYGYKLIFDQPIRQNWPRRTVRFDSFTSHLRLFSLSTATYGITLILRPANSQNWPRRTARFDRFTAHLRLFSLGTATYGGHTILDQPIRQNWPRRTVRFDRFTAHLRLFSNYTHFTISLFVRIGQGEPSGSTVSQLKLRLFSLSTATYGITPIFDQPIRQNWPRRTVRFASFTSQVEIILLKYQNGASPKFNLILCFNLKLRLFYLSTLKQGFHCTEFISRPFQSQVEIILLKYYPSPLRIKGKVVQGFQSQVEIIFLKYCHIWGSHDFPSEKSTI